MNSKKGDLTFNHLILIILGVLVLLAVIIFIFKVDILEWVRNLPEYKYDDPVVGDIGLDEESVSSICKGANPVGFVGKFDAIKLNEGYISFFRKNTQDNKIYAVSTELYWTGKEKNGMINLKENSLKRIFGDTFVADWLNKDLLIAKSDKNGIIFVEDEYMDYNSKFYQSTRFSGKRPPEMIVIPQLDASYIIDGNKICRVGSPSNMVEAWPENIPQGKIIYFDLSMYVDPETKKIIAPGFYSFFNPGSSNILHLENKEKYINVNLYSPARGGTPGVLRIYPDNSIWRTALPTTLQDLNGNGLLLKKENSVLNSYYETNLRVLDYEKIRYLINSGKNVPFLEPFLSDPSFFSDDCSVPVAKILRDGEIMLDRGNCPGKGLSGLKLHGSTEDGEIRFGRSVFGILQDNTLTLDQELVDRRGRLYDEVKKQEISIDLGKCLLNLHQANFVSGYLCRDNAVVPEYSGTSVHKVLDVGDKFIEVMLTYQDNEGICRVTEAQNEYEWLIQYGLKDGELYFNDGSDWENIDSDILDEGQINENTNLRNKYTVLIERKKSLRAENLGVQIYFKSITGLFFNYNSKIYYPSDLVYGNEFIKAIGKTGLDMKNYNTNGEPYYILVETEGPSLFVSETVIYGIDSNFDDQKETNILYSFDITSKTWKKYDPSAYSNLYSSDSEWKHVKIRSEIKSELMRVCNEK